MTFIDEAEQAMADEFLTAGRVSRAVDDRALLDRVQIHIAGLAAAHLGIGTVEDPPKDPKAFLDGIHRHVDSQTLNDMRLAIIENLNRENWLRHAYFALAKSTLESLVGNELCMQRRINLSIQLPDDDSSLLATHADVWSGDSAFEVVVWLPLVDCFATKAMYLCQPEKDASVQARLSTFASAEEIFECIRDNIEWVSVDYGQVLIFDQTLMHGNRINREKATRWSMNCRFKSVLSPYADKKLGEFFEPISLKPVTRRGMSYKLPEGYQ